MKKTLVILAFCIFAMSANAQWFDFSNNDQRLGIGFNLGQNALNTDYSNLGFGMNINCMGIYVDFLSVSPEHKYDNHVTQDNYTDSSSYTINAGYQIPVLSWLRVMPLVGYHQTNYGLTDGSTVNIETNENSSSWHHDYKVTPGSRKHYFNYGIGLVLTPVEWVDISAVASRHAIYGGLTINLGAFVD